MPRRLSEVVSKFVSRLNFQDNEMGESHDQVVFEAVEQAKQEWLNARRYFDNVVDPDLVDLAIYTMDAAERKYMYLLKQAKAVQAQNGQVN